MKSELLPIGSIITYKKTDVMICSYLLKQNEINGDYYDYACCLYPYGMTKNAILVKKEEIEKVIFIGYQDKRFIDMKANIKKVGKTNG